MSRGSMENEIGLAAEQFGEAVDVLHKRFEAALVALQASGDYGEALAHLTAIERMLNSQTKQIRSLMAGCSYNWDVENGFPGPE